MRTQSAWMEYFVIDADISDEEVAAEAMVISTPGADPLYFEDAVNIKHWRVGMDNEIESIGKNGTWTFTELPAG